MFSRILKRNPFKLPSFASVLKFDPRQPRDKIGRWTSEGAEGAHAVVNFPVAAKLNEGYDQHTTSDEIMARFDNNTRAHLEHAKAQLANDVQRGLETNKYYAGPNGKYTPERAKLHKQIVADMLRGYHPSENPTVTFLGGRGGSGKSQFDKKENPHMGVYDSRKTLVIDPDAIKAMLGKEGPIKYQGYNAFLFHEESSHVADMVIRAAKQRRLDMVLDATLKSDKTGVAKSFIKSGYKVDAHYMYLPAQMAAQRAVGRFMTDKNDGSGRLVPPEVVLSNKNNEKNFDKLIPLADNWSVYRNDVKKGEPPMLVARKGG